MKTPILIACLAAVLACRTTSDIGSEPDFAHFSPDNTFGGPVGRLEALKLFPTDFTTLRVCVETGKATIADADIVLEVRMAYAAWLAASGPYTETDWQTFEFVPQPKCKSDDKSFAAYVAFVELENILEGEDLLSRYKESRLTCTTNGFTKSCQGTGMTLGWGGPGSLSYWYVGNPDKWTKLTSYRPSSTTLSPYVDWISIEADLKRQPANALPAAARTKLLADYAALREQTAPKMVDLAAFVASLAAHNVLATEDPVFKQKVQEFYASSSQSLDQTYRSVRAAFSTLLHEVGHQFGMDHADHPSLDSVTGKSATATQNENGQWVTEQATMAYGDPYLFLTADDAAGAASNREQIIKYLTEHK
jgi:hypothetical protein